MCFICSNENSSEGRFVMIPFCYLETDHTQPHVVFGTIVRDKVKGDCFAYIAVKGV